MTTKELVEFLEGGLDGVSCICCGDKNQRFIAAIARRLVVLEEEVEAARAEIYCYRWGGGVTSMSRQFTDECKKHQARTDAARAATDKERANG